MERGTRPWNSTPSTQPRSRSNVKFLSRPNDTTLQQVFIVILTFFLVSLFFHLLSDGTSQDVCLSSVATHFCFPVVLKHVMLFFFLSTSVLLCSLEWHTPLVCLHISLRVLWEDAQCQLPSALWPQVVGSRQKMPVENKGLLLYVQVTSDNSCTARNYVIM